MTIYFYKIHFKVATTEFYDELGDTKNVLLWLSDLEIK